MCERPTANIDTSAHFSTRPLQPDDAPQLSALLSAQCSEYRKHFQPFGFDEDTIRGVLMRARSDVFWGFYRGDSLIGYFMVRGWDEGYEVPVLGVLIDEAHRNYGLMTLTVELSKVICRLRGATRIMYKAHRDNVPAKSAHRLGFTQTGVDAKTGHLIFHLEL